MSSAYETWVHALRTWQSDPAYDMSGLPELTESSLPPSAYQRLLAHFNAALTSAMARWSSEFSVQWLRASSDHERERAMVQMRTKLARRLQLVANPALPKIMRDALTAGAATDIRNLQKQIEDDLTRGTENASSNRDVQERLLKVVRASSLTSILAPNFPLDSLLQSSAAAPRSERRVASSRDEDPSTPPRPLSVGRRRVVVDLDSTEEGRMHAQ